MIWIFAVAVIAQQSLQAKIAPRITEDNGYSDYVRAAELVDDGQYDAFQQWLAYKFQRQGIGDDGDMPPLPLGVFLTDSYFDCQRKLVDRYGGCARLVEMGNLKQVYDPRTS